MGKIQADLEFVAVTNGMSTAVVMENLQYRHATYSAVCPQQMVVQGFTLHLIMCSSKAVP